MQANAIAVSTIVSASVADTWTYYTEAEHVINWNFASKDWHCPKAVNDLRVGGEFVITMAAKDGSMEFELEGVYDEVKEPKHIAYTLNNNREVTVDFAKVADGTEVKVSFDPEEKNPKDEEKNNWQAILDNFKTYVSKMEE